PQTDHRRKEPSAPDRPRIGMSPGHAGCDRTALPTESTGMAAGEAQWKVVQKSIEEAVLEGGSDLESRVDQMVG
ncbi:MAG TPA: hypothetical protein VIC07_06660, partial [Acidimicrobiia bacterium]